jgi:hypothetical protein
MFLLPSLVDSLEALFIDEKLPFLLEDSNESYGPSSTTSYIDEAMPFFWEGDDHDSGLLFDDISVSTTSLDSGTFDPYLSSDVMMNTDFSAAPLVDDMFFSKESSFSSTDSHLSSTDSNFPLFISEGDSSLEENNFSTDPGPSIFITEDISDFDDYLLPSEDIILLSNDELSNDEFPNFIAQDDPDAGEFDLQRPRPDPKVNSECKRPKVARCCPNVRYGSKCVPYKPPDPVCVPRRLFCCKPVPMRNKKGVFIGWTNVECVRLFLVEL